MNTNNIVLEKSSINKHSVNRSNTHKIGEAYEKNGMKTMAVLMYSLSSLGILLQATDIVPGIPDRITMAVIVMGLVAANMIQWKQAITDREDFRNRMMKQSEIHRAEIKEQNTNILKMVMENAHAIQEIFKTLK